MNCKVGEVRKVRKLWTLAAQFWVLALILFLISAFTKSQLRSFPVHAAGNGSQSVTAHDASPASAFTRRPSRFSSPIRGHGLDAMRWASQFTLFFFRRRQSFFRRRRSFFSSSSELLQLCGFNWRVWCEGRQGDRARVHLWVHIS